MSAINTNGINVNYPVPGVNNNSQGFRDNFTSIKTNLNAAGTEITDLQNAVVVKTSLANTSINNDMANTLISNASTRGFRATTFNLGSAISGTVLINASLGDVQYGTIAANTTIQFAGWAPSGTQSNVQLQLNIANTDAVISFPSQVSMTGSYGIETVENFANIANVPTITAADGVSQLDFRFSTLDCGNSITIEPFNRPRQATQVQQRIVPPTGLPGDKTGAVATGTSINQLTITSTSASDYFSTTDTTQLYTDLPVVFTGTSFEANITAGTTYYVRNVSTNTYFTVSSTVGGGNVNLAGSTGKMFANPQGYIYIATDDYRATENPVVVTQTYTNGNVILSSGYGTLEVNAPIVFAETIGTIATDTVYYIKSVSGTAITLSLSRTNGVAGTVFLPTAATTTVNAIAYIGNDIWKRIPLTSW